MRDRIIVKKIYETFAITNGSIYGDDDYDDGWLMKMVILMFLFFKAAVVGFPKSRMAVCQ